jgi:hypothetical protein
MTKTEPAVAVTASETVNAEPKNYKRTNKVAIVGFAPSSMKLAPFLDDSWEIWTLNNIYATLDFPRWDRWFELHHNFREYPALHDSRVDPQSIVRGDARPVTRSIVHLEWLQAQTPERPIYFVEPHADIPAAVPYPLEELKVWCHKNKFAAYFTNSISYMIALAIAEKYDTIGVWGVDMAAEGEYEKERPSVEYWLGLASGLGREVVLPKESELLKARFYGFDRDSDFVAKMRARREELMFNHNQAAAQRDQANLSALYMKGAADNCDYVIKNFGNGG